MGKFCVAVELIRPPGDKMALLWSIWRTTDILLRWLCVLYFLLGLFMSYWLLTLRICSWYFLLSVGPWRRKLDGGGAHTWATSRNILWYPRTIVRTLICNFATSRRISHFGDEMKGDYRSCVLCPSFWQFLVPQSVFELAYSPVLWGHISFTATLW